MVRLGSDVDSTPVSRPPRDIVDPIYVVVVVRLVKFRTLVFELPSDDNCPSAGYLGDQTSSMIGARHCPSFSSA